MNRPWPVVAVLIITLLLVTMAILGNVEAQRLAREGAMDPEQLNYTTSFVHLTLLALGLAQCLAAAVFFYFLRSVARFLFLGAIVSQLLDLIYFWITANRINVDFSTFIFLAFLLYADHLRRRGFLS